MLLLAFSLLLIPLAQSQFSFYGFPNMLASNPYSKQLMSGRFLMKPLPGDSMFLKRYLTFWGMADDVDAMAEEVVKTPLEISISEDGTMVTMIYGEESTLTFGEGADFTDPTTGNERRNTARLVSPNAITLETEAKAEGIYEMRTFTFFPAGVTVSAVASKPGTWSLMGNSVVMNAMMERVDEEDKPKPLTMGWI
eukprot:TRINITY_DN25148_c0_g1_i1.p1 TRINITY_DN25148_c0_g1~~TRINITY_DN25148_c0_g1_i1.p1  ORF type:complete len:195 (+),score=46.69 TRINITY_DN25148_c0_g1_i1:26-610(+)